VYNAPVNGEKTTINTANFGAGIYFVRVNTDQGSQNIKLIVK
jgi:hypothetical protein